MSVEVENDIINKLHKSTYVAHYITKPQERQIKIIQGHGAPGCLWV